MYVELNGAFFLAAGCALGIMTLIGYAVGCYNEQLRARERRRRDDIEWEAKVAAARAHKDQ